MKKSYEGADGRTNGRKDRPSYRIVNVSVNVNAKKEINKQTKTKAKQNETKTNQ